jgi:hypothetical protein
MMLDKLTAAEARCAELEARLVRHEGPDKHPDPEHAPRLISQLGKVRLRGERAVRLLELSAASGREEGNMYEAIEGWNWAETRLAALTEAAREFLATWSTFRTNGPETYDAVDKLRAAMEEKT